MSTKRLAKHRLTNSSSSGVRKGVTTCRQKSKSMDFWRHSMATLLKNKGMSLEDVSALLNHANIDVTKKFYIREDKSKIQSEKDRFEI